MCDFITPALLITSTVVAATSSGIAAASSASQAEAQAEAERQRAADARMRAAVEEGKARTAGTMAVSAARTAYAGAGVDPGEGSPATVEGDIRAGSELDALTLKANGARVAWGHETQAAYYEKAASDAWLQGGLSMGATFLEGAAGMADYYSKNPSNKPKKRTSSTPPPSYNYLARGVR